MLRVNHLTVDGLMDVNALLKKWGVGVKKLIFSKWSHHLVWHNMGTMVYDKRIITSSVLGEKSTENGGAEGDRTPDLIAASDALSQLSYSPIKFFINNI